MKVKQYAYISLLLIVVLSFSEGCSSLKNTSQPTEENQIQVVSPFDKNETASRNTAHHHETKNSKRAEKAAKTKHNHKKSSELEKALAYFKKQGVYVSPQEDSEYIFLYSWIGTRYDYGGTTKKGIDCSGFINRVYAHLYHIDLPRTSQEIYNYCHTKVKKKNLEFGDLIFFKIGSRHISHIGMYLNNGKFIQASTHSGVTVSDLNMDYYEKYFYKAMRVRKND